MSRERRRRAVTKALAARRVEAAWACVNVLRADLPIEGRKALAMKFLDLGREGYREPEQIHITPAQVSETVWRNMQCANRHCSAVLFSELIADELNEFFSRT